MDEHFERNEIYSKTVRAGKRTYFFDVKSTRGEEFYLTITESKRRLQAEDGKFFYEKHKLFLYKEDFEKFTEGLQDAISFIRSEQQVDERYPGDRDTSMDDLFDNLGGTPALSEDHE